MDKIVEVLKKSPLFAGISGADIERLIPSLNPSWRSYEPEAVVIMQGQKTSALGVVANGSLAASRLAANGAQVTASEVLPGGVFGDILSGSSGISPVMVSAKTKTSLVWFELDRMLAGCTAAPAAHSRLLRNLIEMISDKYFAQNARLLALSEPTIRARVLRYLGEFSGGARGGWFAVPHNRQQQADYLACERSALSRELARMKADGLIDYSKNRFKLL